MTSSNKNRTNTKTDKKRKPRATEQPTENRQNLRTVDTRVARQGFPERELPRFRKEASILRTETFGSQRQNHTLPKGSVNHMSLWGDMCEEHRRYFLYRLGLAGGITASVRMRYTYFPKQELKFSPPEKKGEKWKKKREQKRKTKTKGGGRRVEGQKLLLCIFLRTFQRCDESVHLCSLEISHCCDGLLQPGHFVPGHDNLGIWIHTNGRHLLFSDPFQRACNLCLGNRFLGTRCGSSTICCSRG